MKRLFFLFTLFSLISLNLYSQEEKSIEEIITEVEANQENQKIDENLVVKKIVFNGLRKTRDSFLQEKYKKYKENTVSQIDMHALETELQQEGIFDEIKINLVSENDEYATIQIDVTEKITFIPLPFAMYSSSGGACGLIVLDTNAFGVKDMFMIGGVLSTSSKMAMASFAKPSKNGIPGFSIFGSFSKNKPEVYNIENNNVFEYENLNYGVKFSIIEKIGDFHNFALGFDFCRIKTDDAADSFLTESAKIGNFSLGWNISKSDWNGIFMSTIGSTFSASLGRRFTSDSEIKNNVIQNYATAWTFQKPIFSERFRIVSKISGSFGKNNVLSNFYEKNEGSVTILPGEFKTERIAGGYAGFEWAVKKFRFGMLSLYADYEAVYAQDFDISTQMNWFDSDSYKFCQGATGGVRFYLSKIAFPAVALGVSYNATEKYWQFAAAMGVSM